ncbi:MAG: hypothetical protein HETSPECPRED_005133 [Heterodermia speciosa]|uniref:DUF1996 domain-containing protein n=1 Tax=Heterodermia speciosa TaxID=116794 RepID=A0A8H3IC86_9LECA|nr:MAG: hypothetical protein HETSPECPRED_005133 [Heterodermia speciosa]
MSIRLQSLALLVLGVLVQNSAAYFRMSCSRMRIGRIDPVVNFGKVSPHVHKISGASNISPNSTFQTLQTANCTSCEIQADKSAYWTPTLYYQYPNSSLQEVPNGGMTVYYLGRGDNKSAIVPFPPGFRMVSGDKTLRSYHTTPVTYKQNRPIADRVSFACLDRQPQPETPLMTNTNCINGLRAQIQFQSCWDGRSLYKADNSHVAYMSGIDNGVCPPTHPVPLIHLFFEVLYGVTDVKQQPGGRFVFSQGDASGAGFHGDFLNGWDEGVLKAAIEGGCANVNDNTIGSCAPLLKSRVENLEQNCPMLPDDEKVGGLIAKLPGCATVSTGPDAVPDLGCPGEGAPGNGTRKVKVRRGKVSAWE